MKIIVNVITSLGSFKGFMIARIVVGYKEDEVQLLHVRDNTTGIQGELTRAEAVELVDTLGQNINSLDRLTIRHDDTTETIFNKNVLANAIVQFKIED